MSRRYKFTHKPIHELHNDSSPHAPVIVKFSDGTSFFKTIADDRNNKTLHEDHVLNLFIKAYAALKYDVDRVTYAITGRDGDPGHQHDYTVKVPQETFSLPIEITKLTDSGEVHIVHALRDETYRLMRRHKCDFFVYIPTTTHKSELESLFATALTLPAITPPSLNTRQDVVDYVNTMGRASTALVRLSSNNTQVHTLSDEWRSLRVAVRDAIIKKEAKSYPTVNQEDMILVIDDKSLRHNREYMDEVAPLLEYEFIGSRFKEIYILSRKTSPSSKKSKQEVMLLPIKAPWNRTVYQNIIGVISKLKSGATLPMDY